MWTVSSLDSEIEQLKFKDNQLAAEIKKAKPIENSVALIDKWRGDNVDWLDQMRDLVERMPSTERIYLESLQMTRVGSQPPKVIAHGFAREQKDVMELSSALHTSDRYRVMPYQASRTGADNFYPWRIDGQEILLAEPEKPKPGAKGKGGASPSADKSTAAAKPKAGADSAKVPEPAAATEKSANAETSAPDAKSAATEKTAAAEQPGSQDEVALETPATPAAKEER